MQELFHGYGYKKTIKYRPVYYRVFHDLCPGLKAAGQYQSWFLMAVCDHVLPRADLHGSRVLPEITSKKRSRSLFCFFESYNQFIASF